MQGVRQASRYSGDTLACIVAFAICLLLIHPVLSSGLMDDWSYVRTAEVLARTGRIQYNGWATAMLGWPLYLAALFIRLLGDSFTVVRSSTWLVATLDIAVTHRIFLRVGINRWNAMIATCVVLFCPTFLVTAAAFQSDVPGLLAILVCLYCCIRATESQAHAALWIACAALGNTVLGTSRQIAWAGVLVMVPSTIWLLRRNRRVVLVGLTSVLVGCVGVFLSLRWFNSQVYSVAEHVPRDLLLVVPLQTWVLFGVRLVLELTLFLLPVALACLPVLRRTPGWIPVVILLGLAATIPAMRVQAEHHASREWLAPFFLFKTEPNSIDTLFTNAQIPIKGPSPIPVTLWFRVPLTVACVLSAACLCTALVSSNKASSLDLPGRPGMRALAIIILPYTLAYICLLSPRGLLVVTFDRYLLLLLPPLLLLLMRWYQSRVAVHLPAYSVAILCLIAVFSVTSLHDVFCSYRAMLAAADELIGSGVDRTQIDAGWEYDHYTQLLQQGFVLQNGALLPDGTRLTTLHAGAVGPCSMAVPASTPSLHPRFTVAYPNSHCRPVPGFAPVQFRTWLPPFHRTALVAHYVPGKGEVWSESPVSGIHAPRVTPVQH